MEAALPSMGFMDRFDRGMFRPVVAYDPPVAGSEAVGVAIEQVLDPASPGRLLAYLAVSRTHRGNGYGGRLLDAVVDRWESEYDPELIIAEVEDPSRYGSSAETGDPVARVRFYEAHGAVRLDVPYEMPKPVPEMPEVDDLNLFVVGGRALARLNETGKPQHIGDALTRYLHAHIETTSESRDSAGRYRPKIEAMLEAAQTAVLER